MEKLACALWILGRDREQRYIDFLGKRKMRTVYSIPCRGTAGKSLLDVLGLSNTEKTLILAVTPVDTARQLLRQSEIELGLALPGNGIALSVPLDSVGGKSSLMTLTKGQNLDMERKKDMDTSGTVEYSLIIAIAQNGYTDDVMDAARSVGAGGGTVVHAKGTAGSLSERFLGISLGAEKDMILIVAKREARNAIMTAIMEKAGASSEAKAVLFSLPVDSVAGLRLEENTDVQEDI